MSYCRKGDHSDVYMYPHIKGYIDCCACELVDRYTPQHFYSSKDALKHLWKHLLHGHKVSFRAIWRLVKETIKENNL